MPECKHEAPIEDVEYDLDALLAGMANGETVWLSGVCPTCNRRVTRTHTCVTHTEFEEEDEER